MNSSKGSVLILLYKTAGYNTAHSIYVALSVRQFSNVKKITIGVIFSSLLFWKVQFHVRHPVVHSSTSSMNVPEKSEIVLLTPGILSNQITAH